MLCLRCKRKKTLCALPNNFKCADVICDMCGFMAQVKAKQANDLNIIPSAIDGAHWGPQQERLDLGLYTPLFVVLYKEQKLKTEYSVFYRSADLQEIDMFVPKKESIIR